MEVMKELNRFYLRRAEVHFHLRRFVLNVLYMFHAWDYALFWYTCLSKLPKCVKMKSQEKKTSSSCCEVSVMVRN